MTAVEIKSGITVTADFFKGLDYLTRIAQNQVIDSVVVYGGDTDQKRTAHTVLSWPNLDALNA